MIRNLRYRAKTKNLMVKRSPELPQRVHPAKQEYSKYPKRRRNYFFFAKFFFALLLLHYYIMPSLFGENSVHGGYIGFFIDTTIRKYLWNQKGRDAAKEALEYGLEIKRSHSKARRTNLPYAVMLEEIHRKNYKKELLRSFKTTQYPHKVEEPNNSGKKQLIVLRQKDSWARPIAKHSGLIAVDVEESDINVYLREMKEADATMSDSFFQMERESKGDFFFTSFLNRHGGIYVSAFSNNEENTELRIFLDSIDSEKGWVKIKGNTIQSLVAPPRYSFLTCIEDAIKDQSEIDNLGMHSFHAIVNEISRKERKWTGDSRGFVELPHGCPPLNFTTGINHDRPKTLPVKNISVSITTNKEPESHNSHKTTIDEMLYEKSGFCTKFWLWPCNRCLKSAFHGTYAKCTFLCGSCFDLMYGKDDTLDDRDIIPISVNVKGFRADGKSQMIPRVIHQTWFEEISTLHYPSLFSLQNSWKNSGWTYKFYTDVSARQYIEDHFPVHFLEAYDALIPGAYKADLFRYMLLMREGGIYADMDVLLDTPLDKFITPDMSFLTPRDAVGEYADGQYCLWNGIVGAAPGHKILIRAVERLINLILNRADILDLEKEVAQKAGIETETWKVRAVQELLLSGPCALGISMNEALGRDPVARFDVGWFDSSNNDGDIMILMQDKEAQNAMRFTDIERNISFASTDLAGVTKDRLGSEKNTKKINKKKHYSETGQGFWLWGTKGVYKDTMVSKRSILINTHYS